MIYIGTSGYSYSDWKEVFYPPNLQQKEYLPFYADHFPFVELNFSYYRVPSREITLSMIEKTPEKFLFSIKAHKSLTHERNSGWKKSAEKYKTGILPFLEHRRLGGVLFQFPYSFHRNKMNRLYLKELTDSFTDFPIFVEFRNRDWEKTDVLESLNERNIGIVNTDNPGLDTLPEFRTAAAGDRGYLRFHGRNDQNWWSGDNVSRYDYLYDKTELQEWIGKIQEILNKVSVLFIAFNNHHKGQAVKNAVQLRQLLTDL